MALSSIAAAIVALLALLAAPAPASATRSLRRSHDGHARQAHVLFADSLGMTGGREEPAANETADVTEPEHHDAEPEDHSGKPGEGGEPMVPRTHEHGETEEKHEWSYESPAAWAGEHPDCALQAQSPINLVKPPHSHDTSEKLDYNYHPLEGLHLDNNGHNLQVNGKFGTLRLPDGNYNVAQFHFHCPSEHEVEGKLMACEMHIVHQKEGSTGTNDLAVVGILFEEGAEGDGIAFLTNLGFAGELPKHGEQKPIAGAVDLGMAFTAEFVGDFYHYKGSLTTPPCSQTVHWFVQEKPAKVSADMVANFKKLFPDPANNRPVQPLNGRELVEDSFTVKGEYAGHEHAEQSGAAAWGKALAWAAPALVMALGA